VNRSDPRSGPPANPASDPQFAYWEYPIGAWAAGQGYGGTGTSTTQSGFRILTPDASASVRSGTPLSITSFYPFPQNVVRISYFLNGQLLGDTAQPPYAITYVPTMHGPATLQAMAQTTTGTEVTSVPLMIQ
jgi:hypothetical protein